MLRFFSLALDKFLEKSPPDPLFISLFNFRNSLTVRRKGRGKNFKSRLYKAKHSGHYFVKSNTQSIRVSNLILANHTYKNGLFERSMEIGNIYHLNHIRFSEGDLIVDCGANSGDLYLYFTQMELAIRYAAFEPSLKDFECLRYNIPLQHQDIFQKGLFNQNGTLDFFVSTSGADSSFIDPGFHDSVERIEVVRLDSFDFSTIKLLKVEAEGAEPEVLQGALQLLPKIEYISVDAGFERGRNQESTLVDVFNFLTANKFELVSMSHGRIVGLFRNTQH